MSRKISLTFVLMFTTGIAHMSETDFFWTRDRRLDDIIKMSGYPHKELPGDSVVHCAFMCGTNLSCSSFFFLPTTRRCLLNKMVFVKPDGSQWSPGARYFTADTPDCPSHEGYVWMRGQRTCIKVYSSPATFHSAYETCTRVGSRLAVLDTRDKLTAVLAYLEDGDMQISRPYIGAARGGALNGTRSWDNSLHPLYWMNGVKVATSGPDAIWRYGNPDNLNGDEGCMEIFEGEWNDAPCDSHNPFICEKVLN